MKILYSLLLSTLISLSAYADFTNYLTLNIKNIDTETMTFREDQSGFHSDIEVPDCQCPGSHCCLYGFSVAPGDTMKALATFRYQHKEPVVEDIGVEVSFSSTKQQMTINTWGFFDHDYDQKITYNNQQVWYKRFDINQVPVNQIIQMECDRKKCKLTARTRSE
ncbi:MAG: hypothetical protein ACR2PX_23485 [Endozoicomonas sp.]|uniref:hypothetical protein n=1 Tax=Endozoicomonas sp. TaxID=1892382 RepID=UPI003D9AC627